MIETKHYCDICGVEVPAHLDHYIAITARVSEDSLQKTKIDNEICIPCGVELFKLYYKMVEDKKE